MEDWQSIVKENEMKRIAKFMFDGDKDVELTDKYHYHITAHFSKAKQQDAEYCFKHFRNVLDNKVVGRRNRLYKACFIEEGKNHLSKSYNDRHCHLLIQKPKHLTKKNTKNNLMNYGKTFVATTILNGQELKNRKTE